MRLLDKKQFDDLSAIGKAHDEGKEEGIAEGLKKGEHDAKIETAKKMLSKGLAIELISQCTDLTIEVINKIKLEN